MKFPRLVAGGAAAVFAAVLALGIAACGDDSDDGGGEGSEELGLIQLIQPGVHPYVEAGNEGAEREAEEQGLELEITQSDFDPATEIANIQNAIAKGAEAIVIQPASSEGVANAIERAHDEGICTVAMAVNVGSDEYVDKVYPGMKGFVGLNEYESGQLMGESMAKAMGGKGGVVVIQGILPNTAAGAREQGAIDVWEEKYPEIEVLDSRQANFDSEEARSVMQSYIQQYGDRISGVLAVTNNMATAAADVVGASDLAGKVVISSTGGQKAFIDQILLGKATSTVVEIPTDEAAKAVELAADCLRGDTEPVFFNTNELPAAQVLEDDGFVVTPDNVDEFDPQW